MDLFDLISAVFFGNVLTLCVFASYKQFVQKDYKAPWIAYVGFILPVLFGLGSVISAMN